MISLIAVLAIAIIPVSSQVAIAQSINPEIEEFKPDIDDPSPDSSQGAGTR